MSLMCHYFIVDALKNNAIYFFSHYLDIKKTVFIFLKNLGLIETEKYFRQFSLSEVIDQSKIDATLNNGVLRLTLPKVEKATPQENNGKRRVNRRKNQLPYNSWKTDNIKRLRGFDSGEASKFHSFVLSV